MARAKKPKPKSSKPPSKPSKPKKGPEIGIGDFMRDQFEERRDKPAKPDAK